LPLWLQSASPTGAKEAEEHGQIWRFTQGGAPPSASLALGWYVSRFQRFCRFAVMKCRDDKRLFWLKQLAPGKSLS